ncbi:RTA1 like protein family [Ophiocordyceps camponoti-floridani]|uniref:RTA1 like protein family n=1 Tax=Ophiocordyceps camponoti-floridani TaxID=2030778 RepID=A0A8H4VBB9_9HYPO|nr:RTA1 like protein family [Ophiocordyceps camponoti-floridani]
MATDSPFPEDAAAVTDTAPDGIPPDSLPTGLPPDGLPPDGLPPDGLPLDGLPAGLTPGLPPDLSPDKIQSFCESNPTQMPCASLPGLYQYRINLPANAIFLTLFCLSLIWFCVVLARNRRGALFTLAMVAGLLCEIFGYANRIINFDNQWSVLPFALQFSLITLGPTCMAAGIYMCLSRIVSAVGIDNSRIPGDYYTKFFVPCDIMALLLQAIGGAVTATSVIGGRSPDTGNRILIFGLVLQILTLAGFIGAATDFSIRTYRRRKRLGRAAFSHHPAFVRLRSTMRFRGFVGALALATLCIFCRSVFHLAELSEGITGPIFGNQGLFIFFEGVLIVIAAFALNVMNPILTAPELFPGGGFALWKKEAAPPPVIVHKVVDWNDKV